MHTGVFIYMDRFKPHHKYKDFLIGNTYKIRDWNSEPPYKDLRTVAEIEKDISFDRLKDLELLEANYVKLLERRK